MYIRIFKYNLLTWFTNEVNFTMYALIQCKSNIGGSVLNHHGQLSEKYYKQL